MTRDQNGTPLSRRLVRIVCSVCTPLTVGVARQTLRQLVFVRRVTRDDLQQEIAADNARLFEPANAAQARRRRDPRAACQFVCLYPSCSNTRRAVLARLPVRPVCAIVLLPRSHSWPGTGASTRAVRLCAGRHFSVRELRQELARQDARVSSDAFCVGCVAELVEIGVGASPAEQGYRVRQQGQCIEGLAPLPTFAIRRLCAW